MWWVFHVFFHLIEKLEDEMEESLLIRIDAFDAKVEDFAEWCFQAGHRAERFFLVNNELKSMFAAIEMELYEYRAIDWIKQLNQLTQGEDISPRIQHAYLYYLQIGWVKHMLVTFELYMQQFKDEEYMDFASPQQKQLQGLHQWMAKEQNRIDVEYLHKQVKIDQTLIDKLYQTLAHDWEAMVQEAAVRHTP